MDVRGYIPESLIPRIAFYAANPQPEVLLNDIISFHVTLTAALNMCNIIGDAVYQDTIVGSTFDDEAWLLLGNFVHSSRAWNHIGVFESRSAIRREIRWAWGRMPPKKRCKIYGTLVESYFTLFAMHTYIIG